MDEQEFTHRLNQVVVWKSDKKTNEITVDRVVVPAHMCQYCHEQPSQGRASIWAVQDTVTQKRVWRIYCKTCCRNLDPVTHQPMGMCRSTRSAQEPVAKRPRGRPRKDSNP